MEKWRAREKWRVVSAAGTVEVEADSAREAAEEGWRRVGGVKTEMIEGGGHAVFPVQVHGGGWVRTFCGVCFQPADLAVGRRGYAHLGNGECRSEVEGLSGMG